MVTAWLDVSRYDGKLNAAKIRNRGFTGVIHRCTIGVAPRDPNYIENKIACEGEGLLFAAYGVLWPINRNPEKEAENFAENLVSGASPNLPKFLAGDFELGARPHPSGHEKISGQELVEQAVRYMDKLDALIAALDDYFYTAAWYWNCAKIKPHINRGETKYGLWDATYPYDPVQIPGLPPRYSPDKLLPYEISATAKPVYVAPWTPEQMAGWQWTSKGRGLVDGYCAKTFVDRDVMFIPVSPAPIPPPPTDAAELRHLDTWAVGQGYSPLEGWK